MADEPRKPTIRRRRIIERPRLIRALDRSTARVRIARRGARLREDDARRAVGAARREVDRVVPRGPSGGRRRRRRARARRRCGRVHSGCRTASAGAARCDPGPAARGRVAGRDARRGPRRVARKTRWVVDRRLRPPRGRRPRREAFVETIVERSPVRLVIASRVRPSWVQPRSILDGEVLEIPQTALAMSWRGGRGGARRRALTELTSGLVALARRLARRRRTRRDGARRAADRRRLARTLYEYFADELYRGLDPSVRNGLAHPRGDAARGSRARRDDPGPDARSACAATRSRSGSSRSARAGSTCIRCFATSSRGRARSHKPGFRVV